MCRVTRRRFARRARAMGDARVTADPAVRCEPQKRAREAKRRRRAPAAGRWLSFGVLGVVFLPLSLCPCASAEAIWGLEMVYDGLGYDPEHPTLVCGPSTEGNSFRTAGCVPTITERDSYGTPGDPGFSFARYAYKGKSYGPPYNDVEDMAACTYSLSYDAAVARGLERCFYAPDVGGVRTTEYQNTATNLGFSMSGWRLPAAEWKDKLPDYVRLRYDLPPLRLGFEEGTFWPSWKLLSQGLPNFAVTKKCFLEAHSGEYQLCSAYPTERSEDIHGVLRVQSISFALGRGALMFEANGGDKNVPDIPQDPYDIASHGKGTVGVALTRISDGYRVLTKPVRSRRYWTTYTWSEEDLAPYYGEVFRLEVLDYRSGPFGWIAVDSFIIPQAPVIIKSVSPAIGSSQGGTRITITGYNFGSSVDDKTVFIGDKECTDLGIAYSRCTSANTVCAGALSCTVPAGEGSGVTVSVVIGDPDLVRSVSSEERANGKFQAGLCGAASKVYPYSDCEIAEVSISSGARQRGFTYADPPRVTSDAILTATQDSLYEYRITAEDADGDVLTYEAVTLPSFLRFDPTTRLLTGIPYEADVQCRSDSWHPATERCSTNATYDVEFRISDGENIITHKFNITVSPNSTALLVDNSFHWDNALQIFEKYKLLVSKEDTGRGYVAESLIALDKRNVSSPTEITDFNYRNSMDEDDDSRRRALIALAEDSSVDEVKINAAIQYLNAHGHASENLDLIATLQAQVTASESSDSLSGASSPSQQGVTWRGWLNYFRRLGDTLGQNCVVFTNIKGLIVPSGAKRMLSRENVIVLKASTPCNTTAVSTDRFIPACNLTDFSEEHEIWMGFSEDGVTLEDIIIYPDDFEHTDLVQSGIYTQDIPGFLTATIRRLVAQSAKLQEIVSLSKKAPVWYNRITSMLTVDLYVMSTPITVAMQLPTSYPYPETGKYGLPNITVISCEHISYEYEDALKKFSGVMTEETKGGSLLERVEKLNVTVAEYALKCPNLCNDKGRCQKEQIPPVCQCDDGYEGEDCSTVQCPTSVAGRECSGNGACDSEQSCVLNSETGEIDCVGGTGKCSCNYPYFGNDCSLTSCKKNYIVFEGNATHKLDISAGTAPIKAKYEAMGLSVYDVQLSETNGDQAPVFAIPGDEYSLAHLVGVAYVEFASSVEGERARALEPFYANGIPSRGNAKQARYFAQELRALNKRELQLLNLFGKSNAECNAAGACTFETGTCSCAKRYYGDGCEFQYCSNDCGGHGTCNKLTGTCTCDTFYVEDDTDGCVLNNHGLISTTCTDEIIDTHVDSSGRRRNPLHAACLFGTKLGQLVMGTTTDYVKDVTGNVCLECSGYTLEKNKRIYFYRDEPCESPPKRTDSSGLCSNRTSYDEIRRGLGMIPAETTGSSVTFDLVAMRTSKIKFSTLSTQAGIVREFPDTTQNDGCGDCTVDNPRCGAILTIEVDGAVAWSSLVHDRYPVDGGSIEIDVSTASELTLSTQSYTPPYWLSSSTDDNTQAVWCKGAAWGDVEFH